MFVCEALGELAYYFMKRPIRKRAFFRAWRRGELYALVPYCQYENVLKSNKYAQVHIDRSCPDDRMYVMWPWNNFEPLEFKQITTQYGLEDLRVNE